MNADIYYKEDGTYLVGYRNEKGVIKCMIKMGPSVFQIRTNQTLVSPLFSVDVYEDISGRYFPILENKECRISGANRWKSLRGLNSQNQEAQEES